MPARALSAPRARRLPALLALACLAGGAAGCGPAPPAASPSTANVVSEALSGIQQACGERALLTALPAFGADPRREASVLASARMRAKELRDAVAEGPALTFQGKTLAEVRTLAAVKLHECGLGAAAVGL